MSGGFFRGTSADQDTRFSNKQAKLLKTQKFAPELEHLVDMTKVQMDMMKPWIAKRVTELIGFEDEVLINFIYGLLDNKVVNGKEVQISLTGFMERNTGKFMKELWSLLLSAQQNASGVPQQFLDEKEEEIRRKKAESDRIANEIQRKKEKERQENEQEINRKMDGDVDNGRDDLASLEPSKHQSRDSSRRSTDEREIYRSGSKGRSRASRSPHLAGNSKSPGRRHSRSPSKSLSNSRSYSGERFRSPSVSRSRHSKGRARSPTRTARSPPRHSISPRRRPSPRRYRSPPRRRSSHSRRRSISPSRSPPPRYRRRSPARRRSRSPIQRRSRSPLRHRLSSPSRSKSRSPVRRRSPYGRRRSRSRSPIRRRSPVSFRRRSPSSSRRRYRRSTSTPRRRSPSPVRRRSPSLSPVRRRSPSLSPVRRRSPSLSPVRRRSPSPVRHRSPSPVRSRSRLSGSKRPVSPVRRRSPSPQYSSSPSASHPRSSPPIRRMSPKGRSPSQSPRERIRSHEKYSPTRNSSSSEDFGRAVINSRGFGASRRHSPHSLRSSQGGSDGRKGSRIEVPALSPSSHKSLVSESAPPARKRSPSEERSRGSYEVYLNQKKDKTLRAESLSPPLNAKQQKSHHDNSDTSPEAMEATKHRGARDGSYASRKVSSTPDKYKGSYDKAHRDDESSPEKFTNRRTSEVHSRSGALESKSEKLSGRVDHAKNSDQRELEATRKGSSSSKREKEAFDTEENRTHGGSFSLSNSLKGHHREPENSLKASLKNGQSDRSGLMESESGESDKHKAKAKDKKKHKRSEREEIASDDGSSSDSHVEDRKEAKRRRKEEKRLKKEERRRRKEERRRRREERRSEKRRRKSTEASSPSDFEKNNDVHYSDDEYARRDKHVKEREDAESEQKKLEIALREKALESLRAKKGAINH